MCNKKMMPSRGCKVREIIINGKMHERIKVGDDEAGDVCPNCNAGAGQYHHFGCAMERCPACGKKLINCGCNVGFALGVQSEEMTLGFPTIRSKQSWRALVFGTAIAAPAYCSSPYQKNRAMPKQTYATCKICHEEMVPGGGCKIYEVTINGKVYERFRVGQRPEEDIFDAGMEVNDVCHDCFAGYGKYHHFNCDVERCPACGEQLIGCDCDIEFEEVGTVPAS
jgi:hypothetical protein